jgi:hypothetical protein
MKQAIRFATATATAAVAVTLGLGSLPAAIAQPRAQPQLGERLPQPAAAERRDGTWRTIRWDALLPKGWDPSRQLGMEKLQNLQDGDPRANEALAEIRKAWDNAPANPEMNNQAVRIAGFVVPLEGEQGSLREFLLVPYYGACIHMPPPPANQVVHVKMDKPSKIGAMDSVWVSGQIKVAGSDTPMGRSTYVLDGKAWEAYQSR